MKEKGTPLQETKLPRNDLTLFNPRIARKWKGED